jgi:serine protease Do
MSVPVPGRIVESLRRSTVRIISEQGNGSGIVLPNEQVVTNAHVIAGKRVTVESWEGNTLPASIEKIDSYRDLAILSARKLDAPAVTLGSNTLQAGTPVVAVGNPLGFTGAVSSGIVHKGVGFTGGSKWIYADVRLAPGNSGGPLANFHGEVIGINTMIVSGGLALAIPSRTVQSFLNRTFSGVSLGVVVRPIRLRSGALGMLILELSPGGAADTASLLPGDILAGANDSQFTNFDDLQTAIDRAPGAILYLDFYRAGQSNLRRVCVNLRTASAKTAA